MSIKEYISFFLFFSQCYITSKVKCREQISANNSTSLRFSKKTRYSAISRVRIPSRIGGYVYERWYLSEFEPGWYSCFDWTQFLVFNIELRLDLGYRLLRLDSRMNLESVPRFAKIWKLINGIYEQLNKRSISIHSKPIHVKSDQTKLTKEHSLQCILQI